jgi:hypothetical protein
MTATTTDDFARLELESSNLLLQSDADRACGRYEAAADHALQGGVLRSRMGEISSHRGDFAGAGEDWLSAAACFLLATASEQASTTLELAQRLETEGKWPPERADLRAALRERRDELEQLRGKEEEVHRALAAGGTVDVPSRATLDFLLRQVPYLPGHPRLHYAIFRQAEALGEQGLAERHLAWAATFDPQNAFLATLLGYRYLTGGQGDRAVELGVNFLQGDPPDPLPVRLMLAQALIASPEASAQDRERALDVLRPLVENRGAPMQRRAAALALSASLLYELGEDGSFLNLRRELEQLEENSQEARPRAAIAALRLLLPNGPADGAAGLNGVPRSLPAAARARLFEAAQQLNLPA